MAINLQPMADRLVVKPIEREEVTKGGIYLPDTAKERPQEGEESIVHSSGTRLDSAHSDLNRKLIAAVRARSFSKDELETLREIAESKLKELGGEPFKLDNGEVVKLDEEKAKLARRYLMLCRKLGQPQVLHTFPCENCHNSTKVKIGSEPRDKGASIIHFYCYSCDSWSKKEL